MRRERHPDVFEILIERSDYNMSTRIAFRSRAFDLHYTVELRHNWDADPRQLAEYIERLVGDTLHSWDDLRVSNGREMAHSLMPHWEREIHRFMERMEYESRARHRPRFYDDQIDDALRYGLQGGRYAPLWGPSEDPKAKQKARQLLMRNLDAGQLESFEKDGSFRITGKDKKVYTIKTARSFNVEGPDGTRYCGQLLDTPVEDQMLAQKLLLQNEPEKFFKNANVAPALRGSSDLTATAIRMREQEIMIQMMQRRDGSARF